MNVRDSHVAYLVPPNIRRTIEPTDAKILVMPQGNISSHTNKFRERERSFRNAFGKKWTAIAREHRKRSNINQQQQQQTAIATNCENKRGLPSSDGEMATNLGGALRRNSFVSPEWPSKRPCAIWRQRCRRWRWVCHSVDGIWYSVFNKCAAIPGFSSLHPCLILTLAGDWNKKSFLNFLYANRFVFISAFFVNNVFFLCAFAVCFY